MKKRRAAAVIAGLLSAYLALHAAALGYAFYLVHDLANDAAGSANPYVAGARADYGLFSTIFWVASSLALLSAGAFVGLIKQVAWGRLLWLATTIALLASCLVAVLHLRASLDHYAFPLLALVLGWWCLLTRERAHAG